MASSRTRTASDNSWKYDIFDLDEHQDGDLANGDYFLDDRSGRELDPALVRKARGEEMEVLAEHEMYSKVPISECLRVVGVRGQADRHQLTKCWCLLCQKSNGAHN